jgi:hypothetical protein
MKPRNLASILATPLSLVAVDRAQAEGPPLLNKTLVAWVSPANLTQQGGSVLTIDDRQAGFDGIVFGEISPGKWMAGSEYWNRTQQSQGSFALETASTLVYHQPPEKLDLKCSTSSSPGL